ncbi:MAG: hypothetical protein HUK15_01835, partial [Bacteroidales bacterium]|nr:hypothetical protein [Bacteroidales bacterium]
FVIKKRGIELGNDKIMKLKAEIDAEIKALPDNEYRGLLSEVCNYIIKREN